MSKKHHQRTRAEILAKREQSIVEIPVRNAMTGAIVPKKVKPASKYTPLFGAKQAAKIERSALKLAA